MSHWGVVVNPLAGDRRDLRQEIVDAVSAHGLSASIVTPLGAHATADAVAGLLDEGVRHVAVVGGDGTLNQVIDAVHQCGPPEAVTLAVIPAGTGSDFARMFALSDSIPDGVGRMAHGSDYPIDYGVIRGGFGTRAFINIADVGLGAAAVRTAERLPRRLGALKYQAAFWMTLPRFRAAQVEVVAGRKTIAGRAIAVVIANGQYFGGGLNVAPRAAAMDGLLDVQVIDARVRDAPALFPKLKKGLHLGHRTVRRTTAPMVTIEADRPWPVEADGEFIGSLPITVEVVAGRLILRLGG